MDDVAGPEDSRRAEDRSGRERERAVRFVQAGLEQESRRLL